MKRPRSRGNRKVMCGTKVRYRTAADAKHTAAARQDHGSGRLRWYECDACEGWHITSQAGLDFTGLAVGVDQ